MNWTLDQLLAFTTAVQHGSFSAAARSLGKAQSRISTAVANLEADLGIELFDRSARLPVLTPQGQEIYSEAKAVLAQCERLQSRAFTASVGEELELTVAMDEAVPIATFESVFESMAKQFPLLRLTIINGSQEDIARWVDDKQADLGILFHVATLPESLEFASIGQFRQSLVVSRSHPLSKVPEPTLAELNQYRQLVIRGRMEKSEGKALSSLHWHVDSYYYMTALVLRNIGWALIPEHLARDDWYAGELAELSTRHIPFPLMVEMGVVKRRDRGEGPVTEWMYDTLLGLFK